ncbi:MAG TPA: response regulator [Thermoanaerobaculia bacterium]|nr:response regulator [Thermoanaerobaculia bacterium]
MSQTSETEDSQCLEPLPAGERPTVLIAEDERMLRHLLVAQLRHLGIEPAVATPGAEAVRLCAELRPDLVLLDGLLPELHGFEAALFIRNLDPSYQPRIVLVTGIYKNLRYRNEAKLKYGVDEYVIKPVATAQLAGVVHRARKYSAPAFAERERESLSA